MGDKTLQEYFREQAELVDRRLDAGFREQAELVDRHLDAGFREQAELLDRRFLLVDQRFDGIDRDLKIVREGIRIIIEKLD